MLIFMSFYMRQQSEWTIFFNGRGAKRASNSEILHLWKVYNILIFHLILMLFFSLNLLSRASGSIPFDYLCQLWFWVKLDCSKTCGGGNLVDLMLPYHAALSVALYFHLIPSKNFCRKYIPTDLCMF